MEGLEPSTLSGLVFETSAYTGSATSACIALIASIIIAHHYREVNSYSDRA